MPSPQTDKLTFFLFQETRREVRDHASEEDLSNPQSPQSRVLTSISDSDRRQLNPNNQEAVLHRYVLSIYFHATE